MPLSYSLTRPDNLNEQTTAIREAGIVAVLREEMSAYPSFRNADDLCFWTQVIPTSVNCRYDQLAVIAANKKVPQENDHSLVMYVATDSVDNPHSFGYHPRQRTLTPEQLTLLESLALDTTNALAITEGSVLTRTAEPLPGVPFSEKQAGHQFTVTQITFGKVSTRRVGSPPNDMPYAFPRDTMRKTWFTCE